MIALEQAIATALEQRENTQAVNKAYLEFIKANFIIPIEKNPRSEEPEVLFFSENEQLFLPVFTSLEYFTPWAEPIKNEVQLLKLSGVDLLKGIQDTVTVCMNLGSPIYKEFNSSEIARMRSLALKFFQ